MFVKFLRRARPGQSEGVVDRKTAERHVIAAEELELYESAELTEEAVRSAAGAGTVGTRDLTYG